MLLPEDRKLQMIFENTVRLIETQERDRDVIAFYHRRAKEANVPLTPTQMQVQQAEERRKQDEEDTIAAGKWVPILPKIIPNIARKGFMLLCFCLASFVLRSLTLYIIYSIIIHTI